jgi:hypothetical protein
LPGKHSSLLCQSFDDGEKKFINGDFSSSPIETWTYSEKLVYLDDGLTMKERRFGLVTKS